MNWYYASTFLLFRAIRKLLGNLERPCRKSFTVTDVTPSLFFFRTCFASSGLSTLMTRSSNLFSFQNRTVDLKQTTANAVMLNVWRFHYHFNRIAVYPQQRTDVKHIDLRMLTRCPRICWDVFRLIIQRKFYLICWLMIEYTKQKSLPKRKTGRRLTYIEAMFQVQFLHYVDKCKSNSLHFIVSRNARLLVQRLPCKTYGQLRRPEVMHSESRSHLTNRLYCGKCIHAFAVENVPTQQCNTRPPGRLNLHVVSVIPSFIL